MSSMAHDMPMPMPGHHGGGMGDHDMDMQCSMSMVWNSATSGMCIVFRQWRVAGPMSLFASLLALVALGILLEYVRFRIRTFDARLLSSYNVSSGVLDNLYGGAASHRRRASVQRVHSYTKSGSAIRSSGISSGPSLVSSSSLGIGRPSTGPVDSSSASSRSDDDSPLLPANAAALNRRKRKGIFGQASTYQSLIPPLSIPRLQQLQRTSLYVAGVTLSMFLMLVFMTYNTWLIGAVLVGAGIGHYTFQRDFGLGRLGDEKGAACH